MGQSTFAMVNTNYLFSMKFNLLIQNKNFCSTSKVLQNHCRVLPGHFQTVKIKSKTPEPVFISFDVFTK